MLNQNQKALADFVELHAPVLPVATRCAVYRGLADSLEDRAHQLIFIGKAEILEEAEKKCADLPLPQNGKDGAR